jgi:hypothetical protein
MKVRTVDPMFLAAPVKEPWRIGTPVHTSMHAMLARVETDEGITGFGEGFVRGWSSKCAGRPSAFPNGLTQSGTDRRSRRTATAPRMLSAPTTAPRQGCVSCGAARCYNRTNSVSGTPHQGQEEGGSPASM